MHDSFIHIRLLVCMTHRNELWYRLHCWWQWSAHSAAFRLLL